MVAPEDDLIPTLPWSGTDLVYIVADVPLDIRVEEYFLLLQLKTIKLHHGTETSKSNNNYLQPVKAGLC